MHSDGHAAGSPTTAEAAFHAETRGGIGWMTLDRPKALNALDLPMIHGIRRRLEAWRLDEGIAAVVVQGRGRGFCAGGDIRAVRSQVLAGDYAAAELFFAEEYALNGFIARYPKPYVSLIDGICLGGGLGISVHGKVRVVTEAAVMAMPETAIGLTPDIGASFFLPRLPNLVGTLMALCGQRVEGADCVHAGLATAFVPADRLPALVEALASDGIGAIGRFAAPLPPYSLAPELAAIARCFGADSLAGILAALQSEATPWAEARVAELRRMSPSALCWTLASIRAGSGRSLEACLAAELALVTRIIRLPDFAEGVRAMVVDKDRAPRWNPGRIEDVDVQAIGALLV